MCFYSISLTASSCPVLVAGRYPLSEIFCSCRRLYRAFLYEFLRADFLYLPRRRDCREPLVVTFTGYPSRWFHFVGHFSSGGLLRDITGHLILWFYGSSQFRLGKLFPEPSWRPLFSAFDC
jgi:hypothetical protein